MIEVGTPARGMHVSVACAVWMRAAHSVREAREHAEWGTFWADERQRKRRELLQWMDRASIIVAYNGKEFDLEVLHRWYEGDEQRWKAHQQKLLDPMIIAQRSNGRRPKLSSLVAKNGLGQKAGAGCDAPRLWAEGKHNQLQRYCTRDVEILQQLVMQESMLLPGGGSTTQASVHKNVVHAPEAPREAVERADSSSSGSNSAGGGSGDGTTPEET
jgi:hypothetical protein